MAKREIPSPELLRQLVDYEPLSGAMVWKVRSAEHFLGRAYPAARLAKSWNSRYAGRPADANTQGRGYRTITIFDQHHSAHRAAFAMMTGEWPVDQIDHINGDRGDNRWANLRSVTAHTNMRNSRTRKGSSGVVGVRQNRHGTWTATICGAHIGNFANEAEAARARGEREQALGFTARHGR